MGKSVLGGLSGTTLLLRHSSLLHSILHSSLIALRAFIWLLWRRSSAMMVVVHEPPPARDPLSAPVYLPRGLHGHVLPLNRARGAAMLNVLSLHPNLTNIQHAQHKHNTKHQHNTTTRVARARFYQRCEDGFLPWYSMVNESKECDTTGAKDKKDPAHPTC